MADAKWKVPRYIQEMTIAARVELVDNWLHGERIRGADGRMTEERTGLVLITRDQAAAILEIPTLDEVADG